MPNKKKRGFKCSNSNQSLSKAKLNRSLKQKQWTNEQIEAAIKCAQTEFMSRNKAANLHGVPRTTLKDRLCGRLLHGTKSGPKPYLTESEEADL